MMIYHSIGILKFTMHMLALTIYVVCTYVCNYTDMYIHLWLMLVTVNILKCSY